MKKLVLVGIGIVLMMIGTFCLCYSSFLKHGEIEIVVATGRCASFTTVFFLLLAWLSKNNNVSTTFLSVLFFIAATLFAAETAAFALIAATVSTISLAVFTTALVSFAVFPVFKFAYTINKTERILFIIGFLETLWGGMLTRVYLL